MQSYVARRQFLQRCFLARQVSAGKLAKEFLKIGCNLQRDLKHGQKQRSCESSCCKLSFFTCEMSPLWNLSMLKKCTPLGLHGSFLKEHCNHDNQCHDDHLCTKIIPGAPRLHRLQPDTAIHAYTAIYAYTAMHAKGWSHSGRVSKWAVSLMTTVFSGIFLQ